LIGLNPSCWVHRYEGLGEAQDLLYLFGQILTYRKVANSLK
jgi:hypothetical protein